MKIPEQLKNCDEHATLGQEHPFSPTSLDVEKEEEQKAREQEKREVKIKAKEAKNKPLRMLRMPDVMHRTGLSRSTIYALMADNKFPHQIKVSENTAAWLENEIEAYLIARIAERDQETSVRAGGA